ncbi:phosphatidate cytidylyltransferase [Achromobacter mucicolens]|jgi:phosphatidate cytidylyltransferase|uniref:Phosphatidate cytidylyltransferase n=1 Tax=Achromobacter mucicolens TaxID=1389922 RepID=A0ABD4YXE2_9BURK|nr:MULTISPECIES: phosphatidate cytidylyltransferase [Achromobacter]KXJ63824.1 phosphatidate cytidylyltransferase [Achromobacter xylosoxidans]KRB17231.1 phosphatidate cytidylyltransferase [Achromobacter sp. Root170]MCP2513846.1 phosphatidate cytidylyltransferase [Achromobacter mucicolens]MCU6618845.1 phosphatidate cytidylyltransferase [Achromobacter mucicolens]MDH1179779.1 phosphatidate cytidylyltransferase [Achromobacter mucicolens]
MLGQRIVTAVVLLAILAAAMASANPWWFVALLALAAACANWEWLRLTLPQPPSPLISIGVAVLLFAGMLVLTSAWLAGDRTGAGDPGWVLRYLVPAVSAVWLFAGVAAVVRGRADAPPASLAWSVFSVPAAFAAWAVLAQMYVARGAVFVVSLLALVWVADIAAYFAGRAFGKRKLAPRVSPGKTIEGAIAGVLGAVVWIGLSSLWDGTFGHALVERWTFWLALPIAAVLGVLSIVGDLFESLLKRRAGRKDSSTLLPGHGGVYDRIDAILPVAPFALLLSGVLF